MTVELLVFGLSHKTAPLSVRERVAVGGDDLAKDLRRICADAELSEAVLLSTCNRVELVTATGSPQRTREMMLAYFNARSAPQRVDDHVYHHTGLDAVGHLFRVASGMDSMVLGEPQILGQVKKAFAIASEEGTVGTLLSRCFERTFSVAKRVRTETAIARGNVGVSSIACELAEKIFSDLARRRVLLIGAGKMSEVAARSLSARGARLRVVNRNPERAAELAEACSGEARPLEALATELSEADVVISSTSKSGYMISHELMQGVCKMRRYRPLFIIDIAVPRDVDPRVDSLRNVFLYDLDDLEKVSQENLAARQLAAVEAERIIASEVSHYDSWLRSLALTPTIVALRAHVREVVLRERDKTMPKLSSLSAKDTSAIDRMCNAIVNQLLHGPLTELKNSADGPDATRIVDTVQRLFALEVDGAEHPAADEDETGLAPAHERGGRGG